MTDRKFDWRPNPDPASRLFLAPHTESTRHSRYWRTASILDQGSEGACVGHGVVGALIAQPLRVGLPHPQTTAFGMYYGSRRIDEWPGECVDERTTCLSARGWVGPDELSVGDEILTFDMETGTTRWSVVQQVHRGWSSYRVWTQGAFSGAFTDNHRWVVRPRTTKSEHRFVTSGEVREGHEIPRAAPYGDAPAELKWSDDIVELVAWVACEGSDRPAARRGNGVVVSQKVYRERVAALMARLGVANGSRKADGTHCWEISGDLASLVREIAPGRAPRIDWLRSLTRAQLELFLSVCELADGSLIHQPQRRPRQQFHQKVGPILDSWLAAAVMAGWPISRSRQGAGSSGSVETWGRRVSTHHEMRRGSVSPSIAGQVWCPQTEAGTFVARRDGFIWITGNSYEGTSVNAGMKLARELGLISGWEWCPDIERLKATILEDGCVVTGMNWDANMDHPDAQGLLDIGGGLRGGHCLFINGYSRRRVFAQYTGPVFQLANSWGAAWGRRGYLYLREADVAAKFAERAEFAIPRL